jgi:hypothetical protein
VLQIPIIFNSSLNWLLIAYKWARVTLRIKPPSAFCFTIIVVYLHTFSWISGKSTTLNYTSFCLNIPKTKWVTSTLISVKQYFTIIKIRLIFASIFSAITLRGGTNLLSILIKWLASPVIEICTGTYDTLIILILTFRLQLTYILIGYNRTMCQRKTLITILWIQDAINYLI